MRATAEALLSAPRGRRLCLATAMSVDAAVAEAVFWNNYQASRASSVSFSAGMVQPGRREPPSITTADLIERTLAVDPSAIADETVEDALRETVDAARYWQEPDETDVLAAIADVHASLTPIAEAIATSPLVETWSRPRTTEQWAVEWRPLSDAAPMLVDAASALDKWTRETLADEERAARERPLDPHARWSGQWWSVPHTVLTTRGDIADALELVEDFPGWKIATVIAVHGAGRTLEIESAEDWAELCRTYPMDVTASRRHDWFRVTGRDGRWLIPDWQRVAEDWDAAHLTTLGYLSAATTCIEIDDQHASVVGGWAPDSTVWLTDVAREWDEPRQSWVRDSGGEWVQSVCESRDG